MRKSIIAATLAMTVGVAGAQAGGGYADNTQYVAPVTTTAPAVTAPVTGAVVLTDVPAGHWAREAVEAIVEAGLIQGFPDGTFRGNENLTRYQAAMIFHRLLQSGALSGDGISDEDLLVITRGMQEVSTELAAISSRLTDVERLTVEQQARIDAIEAAIMDMDGADNSALVARIDALEARIAALEGRPVTETPVTDAPVVVVPVEVEPGDIVITPPVVTDPINNGSYAGIRVGGEFTHADYPVNQRCINPLDSFNRDNTGDRERRERYCGTVGVVFGGNSALNVGGADVGYRVNADYIPGRYNAVAADVNATVGADLGVAQPYAGLGLGAVNGPTALSNDVTRATDFYANGLVGADFKVQPNIGLFLEGNGKYYFTSQTEVADTQLGDANSGLGFGVKGGVKLFF
ncbi:S-layer homology domain-containing protein [Deinococcus radiophilus]|uniref:S-layer homology domain-containing protein n=1 Tax=Deinococcus radiophilus TaxID=32062 RepID=A0A3S0KEB6_9DEIO|nr:S-layer homology domain-containing protein [Deinococcus radiophilus]RTR28655.1 S-layer homology domain-containing protein [Deinococcus radiophilus]UFA51077.1 S-layer homology domain-containing protein [Deinococcus radiophilus]